MAAGGNDREAGGNAQGSLTSNNRFAVQVGAINAQGDLSTLQIGFSPFSNPGASLLVSAPGSNVVSTSHMLKTERGSTFGNDYTSMQGTSFAAPIVSGIVALMLEANPNLGYRDVQQILALSARKVNDPSTEWSDNSGHHWNGGGMHTSNDYGFGAVDARSAVRLAESWMTQSTAANEYVYSASSGALGKTLAASETLSSSIAMNAGLNIEHIEIDFDAEVGRLGDLTLKLISPDGTQSILLNRQGKIPDGLPGASATDMGSSRSGTFKYSFMSPHDFGENSAGNWTLQVTSANSGLPATLNAWSLRLYGSKSTPDDTYFYTDEYIQSVVGQANRAVLDDAVNGVAGGRNTLNAAAVSRDTSVNLQTGVASIGGAALTIKDPSSIQNIVTGDGNDTLVAGNADALLDGGRGNNTLVGGAGKDFFVVHRREAGSDIISNFEAARGEIIDLVGFRGKTFADLLLTQQGEDVKVDLGNNQSITLKNQQITGISAENFKFQDSFIAPMTYTSSDTSTHQPQEGLGTVILNGGGNRVSLSTDAQGQMKFSLDGTIYSHDSATSDTFVIAAQPGANNYRNALRGFRHGIDKIDLRQVGITDFSQLSITKSNRGTINGLSQIHGVNVTFNGANGADSKVELLYLDTLDISQIDAADFIFAEHAPDLVPTVKPVVPQSPDTSTITVLDSLTPSIPSIDIDRKPITIPDWKPITIPKIDPVVEPTPITTDPNTVIVKNTFAEVTLGDESKTIIVEAHLNKIVAGNGDNKVNVTGNGSNITLGNGNNTIIGNVDKLTVGYGDNKINVTGRDADITLGDGNNIITGNVGKLIAGNGDNNIESSSTMAKIEVGSGNNHIVANGTMSMVKVGDGNNNILTSGTMSTVEVGHGFNELEFSGDMGKLVLGKDISLDNLRFQHAGQDLQISVIGGKQEVTLHNWYASSPERPASIMVGDGHRLMDSEVEHLVQAMAAFAPPAPATSMLSDVEQQRLQPVLAANWH
ncbi:RTX protein [Xenorhabdus hominickii]|uniref:RTX protein n=1 Tax=Xenorhabdus hominickii TaxID=351679 RepID=A0A2G0Q1I6_XENHO|nr:RTX protein [Xenorhabdus hominickii]